MADNQYADEKYYQPSAQDIPDGPLAIPRVVKDENGKAKTIYLDLNTGQEISDLKGYTIYNGGEYWTPSQSDDTNKDGKIDDEDDSTRVFTQGGSDRKDISSSRSITAGGGPPATASNNFGYHSKPSMLGVAGTVAGLVNPGVGAAVGMLSKAYNVGNMEAVNDARKGLGLPSLTGKQQLSQSMKNNKGQIGNINIGDNKYSVGFEAMSPDNKTNLTYNEAKTRQAILGQKITETPKDQVTPAPENQEKSFMSKLTGLDKGFARKALGITKKTTEDKVAERIAKVENPDESPASKLTGLSKGWLSKALTDLTTNNKVSPEVAANLPDVVSQTPTARPEDFASTPETVNTPTERPSQETAARPSIDTAPADTTGTGYSSAASVGLSPSVTAVGPSQANPLGVGEGSVGFTGAMANNPAKALAEHPGLGGIIDGSKPDRIGRVGLMSVDPSKMGLNPAMAAQVKSFQQAAVKMGIADKLSIDVTNAVRTPEQQAAIQAAGFSKTKLGYHNIGLAVDISPTAINDKNQITDQKTLEQSRQIAKDLGLGTLNPSFDPAHIQAAVPGMTVRQVARQAIDPTTGLPGLTPEQDLGVRMNSVPTPTARPDPTDVTQSISPNKTYDSQVGLNAPTPADPENNAFGKMRTDMNSIAAPNAVSPTAGQKLGNTPAALAAMGFTTRSPEDKAAMARTIAGELGQKSLAALRGDDPAAKAAAMAEVGSMAATMENRAATTKYSGMAKTLAPSQYNANFASNAKVTDQNYAANPSVSKALGQFYAGGIPGTNYGATNYHATNMANPPSWSGSMTDTSQLGEHTFGHLKGYSPDTANQARVDAFGTMAGTSYSPGKAKDDMGIGLSTGLGVSNKANTPGYAGMDSGAAAAIGSLGNPGGTSGAQGASGSQGSSASGSSSSSGSNSSGGGSSSAGGLGTSKSGDKSPAGGYASSASKGSTGGL